MVGNGRMCGLAHIWGDRNRGERVYKTYLIPTAFAAMAGIALYGTISIFRPFIANDEFIAFRYSLNLARGFGPTYNRLMPPVEGYTTFL